MKHPINVEYDILIYSYNHVHPSGNENCGTEMTNIEIKMDFKGE